MEHLGRGEASVPTNVEGYEGLLCWAKDFGPVRSAGALYPSAPHGAKIARHLRASGIEVLEVERPKHRRRSSRRNAEKSDSSDAEAAARERFWPQRPRANPRAQRGA